MKLGGSRGEGQWLIGKVYTQILSACYQACALNLFPLLHVCLWTCLRQECDYPGTQFWKCLLYSLIQHRHLSTSFVLPHLCASTAESCLHVQTLTSSLPPWAFRLALNRNHFKAKIQCRPPWGGVVFLEPVLRECNLWHKWLGVYQAVTRTCDLCTPVAPAAIIGTMGRYVFERLTVSPWKKLERKQT